MLLTKYIIYAILIYQARIFFTMKIAFIGQKGISASVTGGVERHVQEIATKLAAEGHEVFAYTRPYYTDPKLEYYQGVHLISRPCLPTKHLDTISHTFMCILDAAKQDYDVIHFHAIGPSSLIWLFKLLNRKTPVVATFHCQDYLHQKWGAFARLYLKLGERLLCRFSDKVITVSKTLTKYVLDRYQVKSCYIPNGVNAAQLKTVDKIKEWGLDKDGYFLAVTRIVQHKGLHNLVVAYQKIRTDKKLVIVGDGAFTDGYVSSLKRLAAGNPNIIFTGQQSGDALIEFFSNAYAFVQPSEAEGLSISLLEAMSYGLPVLVSDIPENTEAIAPGAGFVFKGRDAEDLAAKLSALLDDPATAKNAGGLAKKHVEENYDWAKIAKDIMGLYNEVVMKKNS